jgi:hypothetical protein
MSTSRTAPRITICGIPELGELLRSRGDARLIDPWPELT